MKYLVKNITSGEQILCEKVVIENHDYYVNEDEILDETHYISFERDYATEPKERYVLYVKSTGLNGENPRKVIATTNEFLDLPIVVDEVEELAEIDSEKCGYFEYENRHHYHIEGFKDGYNQAKETYSYTKEDMVGLIQSLKDYTHEGHNILGHDEREAEELFDLWQEQRTKTILVK